MVARQLSAFGVMELVGQPVDISSKSRTDLVNISLTNYKPEGGSTTMIQPLNSANNKLFRFSDGDGTVSFQKLETLLESGA
jgi:hypothetical protein